MKLSTRGGFALQLSIAVIFLVSLFFILGGLHRDPMFGYMYPVSWLIIFPKGHALASFVNSFSVNNWWIWVELGITFFVWIAIFFLFRGLYYYLTSVGDVSIWQAFVICIGIGFLLFILVLVPVYKQLDIWWEAWPEIRQPKLPGGG